MIFRGERDMIIFLDDDPDFSIMIEKKFSNFGEEVRVFNSIESLESNGHIEESDILCFDIKLSNESGIDFVKSVMTVYPRLSFVCFSNYTELLESELISLGIRYHVDKKDGFDELKGELIKILEERELLGLKAS